MNCTHSAPDTTSVPVTAPKDLVRLEHMLNKIPRCQGRTCLALFYYLLPQDFPEVLISLWVQSEEPALGLNTVCEIFVTAYVPWQDHEDPRSLKPFRG